MSKNEAIVSPQHNRHTLMVEKCSFVLTQSTLPMLLQNVLKKITNILIILLDRCHQAVINIETFPDVFGRLHSFSSFLLFFAFQLFKDQQVNLY